MASETYYSSLYDPLLQLPDADQTSQEDFSTYEGAPVHSQMPDFRNATAPAFASGGGEMLPGGMWYQTNFAMNKNLWL
ncbi:hypothetical protein EST38_g5054 [Candolleomyces aberdarensis]|uniref:Uncharacterized protein n=1 Tax=Candolleomyces aberdarensis TaxID=2316362 RepID=A0A4Q2DLG3_9AGAR|nr:hypothetical protein EST38_g5054 [Candolleomyces aberdarensis]